MNLNLEGIYLKYKKHMICIADNILNDKQLAEDAVHITMIKLMKNYHKIENESKVKAYLSVITTNVAKDLYAINKKEKIKEEFLKEKLSNESYVEKSVINKLYINQIVQNLNKSELDLLKLRYELDLTNKSIAQILNINEKLVSKKIRKLEKRIEKVIKKGD